MKTLPLKGPLAGSVGIWPVPHVWGRLEGLADSIWRKIESFGQRLGLFECRMCIAKVAFHFAVSFLLFVKFCLIVQKC